jgi:hypothetical protein
MKMGNLRWAQCHLYLYSGTGRLHSTPEHAECSSGGDGLQGLFSSVISVPHRWFSSQDSWQPLMYITGGNFSTKRGTWSWLPVPPKINPWKVLILPTWIENQNWLGLHVLGYGPLTLLSDQKIHLHARRVSELRVSVLASLTDDTVDWMP